MVVVEDNGIPCIALIDSGVKPSLVQTKNIDMLMASKVGKLEVYDLQFESVNHQFKQAAKVTKVNKSELLSITNPNYAKLLGRYSHLNGVTLNDETVAARSRSPGKWGVRQDKDGDEATHQQSRRTHRGNNQIRLVRYVTPAKSLTTT